MSFELIDVVAGAAVSRLTVSVESGSAGFFVPVGCDKAYGGSPKRIAATAMIALTQADRIVVIRCGRPASHYAALAELALPCPCRTHSVVDRRFGLPSEHIVGMFGIGYTFSMSPVRRPTIL